MQMWVRYKSLPWHRVMKRSGRQNVAHRYSLSVPGYTGLKPVSRSPRPSIPQVAFVIWVVAVYNRQFRQNANFTSGGDQADGEIAWLATKSICARIWFHWQHLFTNEQLEQVPADYANRSISSEGLEAERPLITRHHIDWGDINSGTIMPDQNLQDSIDLPPEN